MTPKISLVASAMRVKEWPKMFNSIKGNKYPIEIVLVGYIKPDYELPPFVKYIYATCKPAQCYQIGFWEATGEIVGWTADDAEYDYQQPNNLDILYDYYKSLNKREVVVGQRPIEDHHDVYKNHYFFGKRPDTPYMYPFGFMDRMLFHELGGYDRRFVCGQSENDMAMRVYEIGGEGHLCMNSFVAVDHTNKHDWVHTKTNGFRFWYPKDREILENAWCKRGYGYFKRTDNIGEISKTRLLPVESFERREDITTVSQGVTGSWK